MAANIDSVVLVADRAGNAADVLALFVDQRLHVRAFDELPGRGQTRRSRPDYQCSALSHVTPYKE